MAHWLMHAKDFCSCFPSALILLYFGTVWLYFYFLGANVSYDFPPVIQR